MAIASYEHRIAYRCRIVVVLILIVTVFCALATQHWAFELFSHFTPLYALAALLIALVLGLMGAWRWMVLAFAVALWNGYPMVQALTGDTAPRVRSAHAFTVFHFNVGLHHEHPSRIVSYLQHHAKAIDVIVLLEVNHDFDVALDDLKALFPYQLKHLEDSPFGIALASKQPLDFGAIALIPSEHYPHAEASIRLPGRVAPLALYALHAPPPISAQLAKARNAKLEHIARLAAARPEATPVVVGDFNLTPWSPYFKRFINSSGLADARSPRSLDHTWPVIFNNANIGLAIDHSFAHPSLRVLKRVIGPDLGSDHLPVTVTFGY